MELTFEEKEQMVQQRLRQYAAQRFCLELDIAAYKAVGDNEGVEHARAEMVKINRASSAVMDVLKEETESYGTVASTDCN